MLAGISFNRERLAAAAEDEMLAATDLADALVKEGVPFREAHGLVGGLVKAAVDSGKPLSELADSELDGVPENARKRSARALESGQTIESKVSLGGTASGPLSAATRAGARGAQRTARVNRDFFDRSVHEVARELIGCELTVGEAAGVIVETEAYDADGSRLPRLHRPDRPERGALRASRPRLRLPLLRDPQPAERGRRAGGKRRGGPDPRPRADPRNRGDARAAGPCARSAGTG